MLPVTKINFNYKGPIVYSGIVNSDGSVLEHTLYPGQYELMQGFPYKDKDGKNIYEGDIIYDHYRTDYCLIEVGEMCVYISGEGRTFFYGINVFFSREEGRFEVVGNKYENPDLLANIE